MSDVERRLAQIEADVRRLKDVEEIRSLRMAYHQMINEGRSDEIPSLFVPGGQIDFVYMCRSLDSLAGTAWLACGDLSGRSRLITARTRG